MPAITVLMAVHDGEAYLEETLDSVSRQTFENFEFVVIDDASRDSTPQILAGAASCDPRVRIIRNADNRGLTASLNRGLREARGDYIARIDADDVCFPERLARQHEFLQSHADHVAVASGFEMIGGDGRIIRRAAIGLDDWQVRWLGGFNPPAPHPTFFFRRVAPDGTPHRYDEAFRTAQDFDFWSRLAEEGKTAVLPDVLVRYRRHDNSITKVKRHEQALNCATVGRRNLVGRLPASVAKGLDPLLEMFSYRAPATWATIAAAVRGCDAMLAHDLGVAPSARHRAWLRDMAAGLLADAILARAGALKRPAASAAFAWHARRHLPYLARAVLQDPKLALKSLRGARHSSSRR